MSLAWGEKIFSNIYPLINPLYNEESVEEKPPAYVIILKKSVGHGVEKKLQEHFTPSFFSKNLCKKNSLSGRVSSKLFSICKKLHLNKVANRFDQSSKLFSIVLKAEQSWLGALLNDYRDNQKRPFIAQHLACVVKSKDEEISSEEVQLRLNRLVALTNIFYEIHGKGHNYVTGMVPQTYFKLIFNRASP
ncbi:MULTISPECIES: hypothetical protein [Parachlamydia]|jgi:hypothetical protein|uniref:Uncharacterized protein n=2 Tax=Parachlamydia acanthamoebae TaxID=83552 RepID=F8L1P8_PARAV|nr:hypothetical protein [Parachlamydia acanthamoebae]EFB40499.1 hypothetical protein pah_c200o053 [Parachlamydia acanthamoebae str. Hall's coccus]KIA77054.1 hypothetical protein DB43_GV00040 [Parachlamydia acanthamoebae]CCB87201.1 putative uncharacterized protein [Parachlamydia acanthamoebae UV-7]